MGARGRGTSGKIALPLTWDMRPPKYPLESLADLRDKRVERALGDLSAAVTERDAAERGRLASEEECRAHAEAAGRIRGAEREALGRGELRAADLAHAGAWEARMASERQELSSAADRARAHEESARAGEDRARGEVMSRRAEAQTIAKDRARWRSAQQKGAAEKEEEALSEAWRPSKS
jgi:hypothetical protein